MCALGGFVVIVDALERCISDALGGGGMGLGALRVSWGGTLAPVHDVLCPVYGEGKGCGCGGGGTGEGESSEVAAGAVGVGPGAGSASGAVIVDLVVVDVVSS